MGLAYEGAIIFARDLITSYVRSTEIALYST
jgi:hypothetical protein